MVVSAAGGGEITLTRYMFLSDIETSFGLVDLYLGSMLFLCLIDFFYIFELC